jgi:diaminopimelate epimerase
VTEGIPIAKMSGAGNDFVLVERGGGPFPDDLADWARRVCRRGQSVGADGVVVVERVGTDRLRVEFRNPDGTAAFCGNGTRCAARFARLRGWTGPEATLETAAGVVRAKVDGDRVRIALPPPRDEGAWVADVSGERIAGRIVWAGTPHLVIAVRDVATAPLERWGPPLRRHDRFAPDGTNVDLVEQSGDTLRVRTWEKGVEGETLCCGSGAIAAAMAVRIDGGPERVHVVPRSGARLEVLLPGPPGRPTEAVLTGDARMVFEGTLHGEATRFA